MQEQYAEYAVEEALGGGDPMLLGGGGMPAFPWGAPEAAPAAGVRRRVWRTRFLPEHIYEHYARQAAITSASLPAGNLRHREIPPEFISVFPLDRHLAAEDMRLAAPQPSVTGTFGYVTSLFKVVSTEDGLPYALRRVESVRAPPAVLQATVAAWARVSHPAIIPLRRAFSAATPAGGGSRNGPPALFFLHDFYPGARSLRELYLDAPATSPLRGPGGLPPPPPAPLPEATLWSYAVQLVSGLRVLHEGGLTLRGIRAAHVLVTGRNRVRLSGSGVLDVLESDHAPQPHAAMARADVISLGHLLLQLAARSPAAHAPANLKASLESLVTSSHYSPALARFLFVLISKQPPIHEVCAMLLPQLLCELDGAYEHTDALSEYLSREADNGRIMRLLLKLGFVNERPEHEGDAAWAETGERYLLKLFRDFVFHQVTEDGRPVIDVAHALDALNHLDVGSPHRALLSSRDASSILVTNYAALRSALHASFDELRAAARAPSSAATAATAAAAAAGGRGAAESEDWASKRPKLPAVVRARTGGGRGGRGGGRGGGFTGLSRDALMHAAAAAGMGGGGGGGGGGGVGGGMGGVLEEALRMGLVGHGMGGGGGSDFDNNAQGGDMTPQQQQALLMQALSMQQHMYGGGSGGGDGTGAMDFLMSGGGSGGDGSNTGGGGEGLYQQGGDADGAYQQQQQYQGDGSYYAASAAAAEYVPHTGGVGMEYIPAHGGAAVGMTGLESAPEFVPGGGGGYWPQQQQVTEEDGGGWTTQGR